MSDDKIKEINFDGDTYLIEDLTPRVIDGFNMLAKLQQEIADISYQLKKCQAAQVHSSKELKEAIQDDKIKSVQKEE